MEDFPTKKVLDWVDNLGGAIVHIKQRTALYDLVGQRNMTGRNFSMILNQHALVDFIPDLPLSSATKIRKCWHQDFPQSKDILPPGVTKGPDPSQVMADGTRYDPCQDGTDFTGFEGYAGYKPGPGTGRGAAGAAARGRGSTRGAPTGVASSARSGAPSSPTAGGGMARSARPEQRPASKPVVTVHLEELRAALDCVAERADLNRQDVYVWVKDVISDDTWKPLWDSFTNDLMRQGASAGSSRGGPPPAASRGPDPYYGKGDGKGGGFAAPQGFSGKGGGYPEYAPQQQYAPPQAPQQYAPPPQQGYDPRGYPPQEEDDELSQLPELQKRIDKRRPQQSQNDDDFDDSVSCAQSHRSEAQSMASNAMSAWLHQDAPAGEKFDSMGLANWLRMLPTDRLDQDMLKAVARFVLDNEIDEKQFEEAVKAGKLGQMGASDPRQQGILARFFEKRQTEAMMAEAAKQSGSLNAQLRVQADTAWKARKMEF